MAGIGKSALIKNTLHYLHERKVIDGGIFYFDA